LTKIYFVLLLCIIISVLLNVSIVVELLCCFQVINNVMNRHFGCVVVSALHTTGVYIVTICTPLWGGGEYQGRGEENDPKEEGEERRARNEGKRKKEGKGTEGKKEGRERKEGKGKEGKKRGKGKGKRE
jgi:hypothetical protein